MSSIAETIITSPATTATTTNDSIANNNTTGNNNNNNNIVDAALEAVAVNAVAQVAAQNPNNVNLSGIDQNQILALLRTLPQLTKLAETSGLKEAAAETLSNLSQISQAALQQQQQQDGQGKTAASEHPATRPSAPAVANYLAYTHNLPLSSDPGPNSHPHGPPGMGLSLPTGPPLPPGVPMNVDPNDEDAHNPVPGDVRNTQQVQGQMPVQGQVQMMSPGAEKSPETKGRGGRRPAGVNGTVMGSDEWSRQRKDNHKEVERRRRGNINDGINELARIVPNGSGEKAKGAILSRACQYIHHLKENEARNIEKWTLEKLLMDQAMGDLQAQLEEVKRLWEEERRVREELEARVRELDGSTNTSVGDIGRKRPTEGDRDTISANSKDGNANGTANTNSGGLEDDRGNKRQRLE